MDVTELLNTESSFITTPTAILLCLGALLILAGWLVVQFMEALTLSLVIGISGIVLIMAGVFSGSVTYDDSRDERGTLFQSVLFDGYGFNVDSATDQWDKIADAGENGVVTKLSREGVEQDVRIHIEGTRLVISGPDGVEIPTNAQLNADGSN